MMPKQNRGTLEQYTARDLSRILGLSLNAIYGGFRKGDIPHLKIGGRIIVPKAAFDTWLADAGMGPR